MSPERSALVVPGNYELTDEQELVLAWHLTGARTVDEVLSTAGPTWLIEGWLASSVTVVDGKPEAGKSTLVAAMAAAVANKTEWAGVSVSTDRHGPVVIIVTDPGDAAQWALKAREHGVPDEAWRLITYHPDRWDDYETAAKLSDARLLVFDNITGALDGPVNDADPSAFTTPLSRISNAGVPVIAIAHSPKGGGKGPIGPTAYTAWRRHGIHVSTTKNGRKVSRTGNLGQFPDVYLDGEPAAPTGTSTRPAKRDRATATKDLREAMADYVVKSCQGLSARQAGKAVAGEFDLSESTGQKYVKASGPVGALLVQEGAAAKTRWSRR